jgi:hypothetical protein
VSDSVLSFGTVKYVLQRAKRAGDAEEWSSIETWSIEQSNGQLIANESNVNYIKMVFPLLDGASWNGNLLNNSLQLNKLNEDKYKITSFEKPYTSLLGQSYPKTITVLQEDEQSNLLYRDTRTEIYAFDTGLVYKESYLLNYFTNSQLPCFGQNKIEKGYVLKQSLLEYIR